MKIAYLILAHHQPKQFHRLIKTLNSKNVSFYVNIDLKADISEFNHYKNENNVFFIKERLNITRFGYSQPLAMMRLIQAAAASKEHDYFIFLSGNDYPIKSNDYIYNYLNNNYPTNFINFYPLVGNADYVKNIKKYYFVDFVLNPYKIINLPARAIRFILNTCLPDRSFIKGITPYRGSTSWCLNRHTINYMVDYLDSSKGKKFIRYFKSVWGSDEIFFQTLVLNSPFAKQCQFYERDIIESASMKNENKANLHYIDWSKDREDPAVLDMRDYDILKESDLLFARKFFENRSDELSDNIDINNILIQQTDLEEIIR
jgi:hypothetical protein